MKLFCLIDWHKWEYERRFGSLFSLVFLGDKRSCIRCGITQEFKQHNYFRGESTIEHRGEDWEQLK